MKKMSKTTQLFLSSTPVVFFGSGPVAKDSLDYIIKHFEVEAIITKPSTTEAMIESAGNTPVCAVQNAKELDSLIISQLFKSQLGILVDFGVIVSKAVIDYFPLGIVNSHFSLLPRLRGADPISFSLLNGDSKTGVSLMLIDEKMDTGKLITQKSMSIQPGSTTPDLTKDLIELSNQLLTEYLPDYISGKISPRSQPHPNRATYSRKLTKEDGKIEWSKPAEEIEREIRAYYGWPKSTGQIAGKDVIVLQAHVVKESGKPGSVVIKNKKLILCCGKDALQIDRLQPTGKKEMSGADFCRGYIR